MEGVLFTDDFTGGEADLSNAIAKLGFNDTPLFSRIRKGVPSNMAQIHLGHNWNYEEAPTGDADNAHAEGGAAANAESFVLGSSVNHYQIVKHTYGVTGSNENRTRRDGDKEMDRQRALAYIKHRKTIEIALMGAQAPVQRVKGGAPVIGKMGGLKHWATVANTLNAGTDFSSADLSMRHLKTLLQIAWSKGMPATHIFMGDDQKDILDDILDTKTRTGQGTKVMEADNIEVIKNLTYAPNVQIIQTPYLANDEIVAVNMNSLALVYERLTKDKLLPETSDNISREVLSELTLRVNNPYAVTRLHGLNTL